MTKKVFDIISKIAEEHSRPKGRFGYLTRDDLKNEIWLICLEKLEDFKKERGELERFLRVTVHNRLINKYKDITKFTHSPCPRCPYFDPGKSPGDCSKFGEDKHLCSKWENYRMSLESRKSLLTSAENNKDEESSDNVLGTVITNESKEILLRKISDEYKNDLLQFISGEKISKKRIRRLKKEIKRIMADDTTPLTIRGKDADTE